MYFAQYAAQLEQLEQAEQEYFINHCDLLAISVYDDIVELKKKMILDYLKYSSSGTIARIINNTRYSEIDKAVNKTILYITEQAEEEYLHDMSMQPEDIEKLIRQCYQAKDKYDLFAIGGN